MMLLVIGIAFMGLALALIPLRAADWYCDRVASRMFLLLRRVRPEPDPAQAELMQDVLRRALRFAVPFSMLLPGAFRFVAGLIDLLGAGYGWGLRGAALRDAATLRAWRMSEQASETGDTCCVREPPEGG